MNKLILTAALGAVMFAAQAGAQPVPGVRHAGRIQDMTRQQAQQMADHLFDRFDLNRDGTVTRDEAGKLGNKLMAHHAATGADEAPGLGGHTLRFLEHAFAGADAVTRTQFEAAMLAHFDQMDTNHDGVVTAGEREQARDARHALSAGQ